MNLNTVIFKRRAILGDLFDQCDAIESIPVYLNGVEEEPIGTVEESPASYSDAFVFKLPSNVCKSFSIGDYHVGFDYNVDEESRDGGKKRVKLNHIVLVPKQKAVPYGKRSRHHSIEQD